MGCGGRRPCCHGFGGPPTPRKNYRTLQHIREGADLFRVTVGHGYGRAPRRELWTRHREVRQRGTTLTNKSYTDRQACSSPVPSCNCGLSRGRSRHRLHPILGPRRQAHFYLDHSRRFLGDVPGRSLCRAGGTSAVSTRRTQVSSRSLAFSFCLRQWRCSRGASIARRVIRSRFLIRPHGCHADPIEILLGSVALFGVDSWLEGWDFSPGKRATVGWHRRFRTLEHRGPLGPPQDAIAVGIGVLRVVAVFGRRRGRGLAIRCWRSSCSPWWYF